MALDPAYFFYSDGTISLEHGSDIAIGDMVFWDTAVLPFDTLYPNDGQNGVTVIKEVLSVNQLRLAKPWTGPTLTTVPYFVLRWVRHTDPRVYAVRVSEYLTRLKGIPENIEQVAGEIHADRVAVDAAMVALQQIEVSVNADRAAAEASAGSAQGAATAAADSADEARQWAEAASSGVLPDNGVTNAKLADMPAGTVKMRRPGAGAGDPGDVSLSDLKADLGISQFAQTLLDDLDANAVLATLGLHWRPLGSYELTAGSARDVAVPNGIKHLRFFMIGAGASTSAYLGLRVSRDGGSSFLAGNSDYLASFFGHNGTTIQATQDFTSSHWVLTYATADLATPMITSGHISVGSADEYPRYDVRGVTFATGTGTRNTAFGGHVASLGAVNAVRFLISTGTFLRGRLIVEGTA